MSNRYQGGVISATPPTLVAGAGASGTWTLEQQMQATAAGLWPVNGPFYIEEVFSTYLYTGNGSTQTITNGIDLSGKGGLVWTKGRSTAVYHNLEDTVRGAGNTLWSNATSANYYYSDAITSFGSTGYSLGADGTGGQVNANNVTYASWTFRKQAKFFDIQQVTLGSSTNRQVAHNLASVPGVIIGKKTNGSGNWVVYHRSLGINKWLALQTTDAETSRTGTWGTSNPTATDFYFDETYFGSPGDTYIFYLFAHDAGGFGLTGTDNVISCGSYTGNGSATGPTVTLGYEPQWLLVKNATSLRNWFLVDNMRGLTVGGVDPILQPNSSSAEQSGSSYNYFSPTATGFAVTNSDGDVNANGDTYIYIAIRRGPMAVPTLGTSVFSPQTWTGNNTAGRNISTGFPVDFVLLQMRTSPGSINGNIWYDRLRGLGSTSAIASFSLRSYNTDAETSLADYGYAATMDGFNLGAQAGNVNGSNQYNSNLTSPAPTSVSWNMRRAPGFFDEVCYTGTGSARTVTHNLGVAPEMMIVKVRDSATNWAVYSAAVGNNYYAILNLPDAPYTSSAAWNNTTPTSSVFTVGTNVITNGNGYLYVAYLFASCPGVSKVGSYTGTGTTLQVDCGFTGGSRFVMIKRTDSTGDWYVWDSARGIVAGNDPYLLLNSTAAEVTNTDYVDTYSAGFEISSTAPAAINASGGTFIFLAIA